MELSQFPQAIADAERFLLKEAQSVRWLRDTLESYDREIDYSIASDPELKNDIQRKAARGKLQLNEHYQSKLLNLRRAEDARATQQIEVDYLKNSFSVAKLEKRELVAQLEASVEGR